MTLYPGDIITTGTPPGVGMARKPQVFLKDGDLLNLKVDLLGSQTQKVTKAK
jgi:2-keto-4-pentenoate hydratase/2-oxohepta-3-ene-1,7-dioic acid hydratase in catechol pathway